MVYHKCFSIRLCPLLEILQAEPRKSIDERAAGSLVPARKTVIFVKDFRQPFGYGESFILSVRDRLEKSRAHLFPVVVGDPSPLGAEQALENHTAMAG